MVRAASGESWAIVQYVLLFHTHHATEASARANSSNISIACIGVRSSPPSASGREMWKNPAPARSCAMSSGIRRAASIWSRSAMMRGRNARATSSRLKKTADCGDEGGFCDARWSKLTAAAGGCLPQLQPAPDHRRQANRRNCAAPAPKKVAYPAVFTACFRIADHCEACSAWWSRTIPTARARSSGEYGGTRFVMAPSSQELEPPGNSTIQLPILMPATMRSGVLAQI
jgi:hypothetical protein